MGVGAGFLAAAGCAWLLVAAFGGGSPPGPQSAGCDRLCGAGADPGTPSPSGGATAPPTPEPGGSRSGEPIAPGSATPPAGRTTDGTPQSGPSTPSSSPSTASGQVVRFTVTSHWATGYRMTVTVPDTGPDPISDWTMSFHVTGATLGQPTDQPGITQTGQTVEWVPQSWQTPIRPGGVATVGFTFDGAWTTPTGCVFKGAACTFVGQGP
jgi:hypothetical protein